MSTIPLYDDVSTPDGAAAKAGDTDREITFSAVINEMSFFLCFTINPVLFIYIYAYVLPNPGNLKWTLLSIISSTTIYTLRIKIYSAKSLLFPSEYISTHCSLDIFNLSTGKFINKSFPVNA